MKAANATITRYTCIYTRPIRYAYSTYVHTYVHTCTHAACMIYIPEHVVSDIYVSISLRRIRQQQHNACACMLFTADIILLLMRIYIHVRTFITSFSSIAAQRTKS